MKEDKKLLWLWADVSLFVGRYLDDCIKGAKKGEKNPTGFDEIVQLYIDFRGTHKSPLSCLPPEPSADRWKYESMRDLISEYANDAIEEYVTIYYKRIHDNDNIEFVETDDYKLFIRVWSDDFDISLQIFEA